METVLNGANATQQRFEIDEPSQVSYARRGIGELAATLGFSETVLGKLAIVVTECATNQLKHAQRGELLVRAIAEPAARPDNPQHIGARLPARHGIELIALDSGPGIPDLHASFTDGYTTAGSPGNGMGAIRRLADDLDIWSAPSLGTALRVVLWADGLPAAQAGPIEYGAINLPLPGEILCGDAWCCGYADDEFTVLMADGLGHGPLAHTAALAATDTFARIGASSVVEIVEAAHEALRPTRGAALGVARIPLPHGGGAQALDGATDSARFCGVGNIAASVWTPVSHRHLVSHAGIVGHTLRKAQEFQVEWPAGALLILHSDGLATRWDLNRYPGLSLRHPGLIAAVLYRDFSRGRDDVTVVVAYVRRTEAM